jgi:hypothetical protein
MMKRKLAALLIVVSSLSNVAMASSPFLVNHAAVEAGGGRAAMQAPTANRKTLAESLVQLRQCHAADHQNGESSTSETPSPAPQAKESSIQVTPK